MANLSNINNILRVSSSGVGLNKNNTGPSELDIESAGADMIDMTRTGQKTYRFAISGTSAFSLFDVAANEDRLIINSSGNLGLGTTNIRAKLSFPNIVDTNGYDVTSIRLWDNASTIFYGLGISNSQFNLRAGSADDGFAFWAGESHRMQIQSTSGNVGIGTASPFTNLEVAGSGLDSIIRLYAAGGTANIRTWEIRAVGVAGEGLLFRQVNDANNSYTNRMIIDTDGNVGIGTITPGSKLVVSGGTDTTYNDGTLKVVGSIALNSANNLNPSLNRWALRPRAGGVEGSFDIYDARNSLSRLTIVNSGNVGIGDTSPQGKLEVSQNMSNGAASAFTSPHLRLSALNTTDSTGFVGMTFATSSANNYGFSWGALRTVSALGGMHLRYHANSSVGTDIFNIDYTGNVTIASTRYIRSSSSGGYLTIQGGATFPGGRIDMYGGSSASAGIEFMTGGATASPTLRLRIDGDTDDSYFTGNLGIGTTSPSQKLQVDGGATGLNQGIPPTSGTTQNGILRLTSGSAVYGETFDFGMNVGPTYAWIQATNKGSLAVNYNLALNPNGGNVGIGVTSPNAKLDVNGALKAQRFFSRNGSFSSTAGNWHNVVDLQQSEYENRTLICSVYTNGTHSYSSATVNVAYNGGNFVLTLGNKISSGSTDIRISGAYLQFYTPWTTTGNFWRITIN